MELMETNEVGFDFSKYEQIHDCGIPELPSIMPGELPQPPKKQRSNQTEKVITRSALRISMSKLGNRSVRLLAEYKDNKFSQFLIERTEVGPYSTIRTEIHQADSRRRTQEYFDAASQFTTIRNELFPPSPFGKGKFLASHIDIL